MKRQYIHPHLKAFMLFVIMLSLSGCSVEINVQDGGNRSILDRTPGEDIDIGDFEDISNREEERDDEIIIHNIDIEDIDDEETELVANIGSIIDIYSEDELISKIMPTEAISGMTIKASFNSRTANDMSVGDIRQISKNHFIELKDVIYRDNQSLAAAIFNFISEDKESHPDYLIENKIGLNEYLYSMKTDNDTYRAHYDISTVTVAEDARFAEKFHDSNNMIQFDGDQIYKVPGKKDISWVSYYGGKEYVIEIANYTETIIREYFWKYPPHLNSKTLCMKSVKLGEDEESTEYFNDDEIPIQVQEISLSNFNVRLLIDDIERTMDPKDAVIVGDTVVILESIDVMGDENKIKICLA